MNVKELADQAAEYKRAYEAKEITDQEFKTLVRDLDIEVSFDKDAADYEQDIEAHTILLEVAAMAAIIPWAMI